MKHFNQDRTRKYILSASTLAISLFVQLSVSACSGKPATPGMSGAKGNDPTVVNRGTSDGNGTVVMPATPDVPYNSTPVASVPTNIPTQVPSSPEPIPVSGGSTEGVTPPSVVTGSPSVSKDLEPGQLFRNGKYTIRSVFSKKCMTVHFGGRRNGAAIVQSTCNDENDTKFNIDFVDHKYYRFTNFVTQKSVAVKDGLVDSEAGIIQEDYLAEATQQWIVERVEGNTYLIKARNKPNLCLDVASGSTADNAPLQLWRECGGIGQKWTIMPTL